jgi:hypothetical protein
MTCWAADWITRYLSRSGFLPFAPLKHEVGNHK